MRAAAISKTPVIFCMLILAMLATACSGSQLTPANGATPASPEQQIVPTVQAGEPTQPVVLASTPDQPTPTAFQPAPTKPVNTIWMAPYLPQEIQELANPALQSGNLSLVDQAEQASLRLEVGEQNPAAHWVYAVVAPFPTVPDGVTMQDVKSAWAGQPGAINPNLPFAGQPLLMDESTAGVFTAWWGAPADGAIKVLPTDELVAYAWDNRPTWAIVPFEALEPRWKVMQVDGQSPIWKEFQAEQYPLTIPFSLNGDPALTTPVLAQLETSQAVLPITNRDPQKLTTVILTGVTALVRATAETMRRRGLTYPANDIGEILNAADITHVSNEVPFDPDCPQPDPYQVDLVFCSRPEYIQLLEAIGTDVVELSGDHFGDQGPDAMRYTLEMYKERGWPYYAGGANEEEALKPVTFEVNGNKIAFIGCNGKGGGYATARGNNPGAVACEEDYLRQEIARLRSEGYNVIFTSQHFEYYTYVPQPPLVKDFHAMAEAGANIVSGSQAHQPHGMEFYNGAFIHYGLGNLFFDQYFMGKPTSQGFLDRYVFYDNRLISIEPIGIWFVDFARPRLMTADEKADLMNTVFNASRW